MAVKIDDDFDNLNWLRKNPAPVGYKPKKKTKKKVVRKPTRKG